MKLRLADLLLSVVIILSHLSLVSCDKDGDRELFDKVDTTTGSTDSTNDKDDTGDANKETKTMKITIGNATFTATLYDNATAEAFKQLLPLTVVMRDFNGNEKCYSLSKSLPGQVQCPGTIHSGDIMVWAGSTLVLFYDTFQTSYSYSQIGKIDNIDALVEALGTGSVTVKFELQ